MPRGNKILIRSGTTTPSASDFATNEPAWDRTAKKLYVKAGDGTMVEIGAGGGGTTEILEYATTASFPATGTTARIYLATDTSRLYRWDSSGVYVELGAISAYDSRWEWFKPVAPSNVVGTAGNAQVSLTWTGNGFARGPNLDYLIQYSSNGGTTWTNFSDSYSDLTSATVTGLQNGVSYVFRVAAVSGIGTGPWSAASAAVTPTAGDALWSNVSLLLHMDGSGATFTDSSGSPKTITANGSATQSTAQSKFGGKSLLLNGTDSYLSLPASSAFNFDDFTVEAWVYPTSYVAYAALLEGRTSASYQNYICGLYYTGGVYRLDFVTAGGESARLTAASTSVPLNQWSHIAWVRSGSTLRCYVNGTQDSASVTYSSALNAAASTLTIGKNVDGNYYDGYIDEYRVTKAARYTASFTPPTAAFPDS